MANRLQFLRSVFLILSVMGSAFAASEPAISTRAYAFAIPSQALSPALLAFSRTTGISLLVARSELGDQQAPSVEGAMTANKALQALLADSDLGFKFIDRDMVSISMAHADVFQSLENRVAELDSDETSQIGPIEEVIVSARRRNEPLQKIPIPVTVLSSRLIDETDIENLGDIALRVPGLSVSYFSVGQPNIHMRGVGSNDDGAALDNSVVLFLDDIYIGRISTIDINVLDLERIEVLRGPQGTLYGKNAIGGAINMVSALPVDQAGGEITLGAGNLDAQKVGGKWSGPLTSPDLLGRLSISSARRDGWQDNVVLNTDNQHDESNDSVRAKLLYLPREDLDWYLAYDYSREQLDSTGRIPVVGRVPLQVLDDAGNAAVQRGPGGSPLLDNNGAEVPLLQLPTELFTDLGGDPQHATNGVVGFTDRRIAGLTSRISWEGPKHRFSSITGFRDSEFEWLEDSTGLPDSVIAAPITDYVDETHRQFSQELRWSSGDDGGRNFLLGVYYLQEETNRKERFQISDATARSHQKNTSKSFAVFGEVSYHIGHATKLTLGGRYTLDKKDLSQQSWNGGSPAIILEDFELDSSASWQDFSPSAALSWHGSDNVMLFARVARGFKNGGFQGVPGTLETAMREIDPETAWDYELGVKSRWHDNRVQLNVVGFYSRYKNLQVTQFRTVDNFGLFETSNAGTANLQGVEVESIFHATENLELSGSYAWLDARYDDFLDVDGRDFSGNRLRQAPEHTANLSARYQWPLRPGNLSLRLDYSYQSKNYQEPDNSVTVSPSYNLLDTKLTFTPGNKNWEVSLWAKNVLDEEYIAHLYLLGGNDYALFGTPRTYGVSLRYSSL
ncbi:MAG: iron complex outermembrane receptor protein [Alcanivorax sp.]|jgi:iron complex outermembrane receptor protein